MATTEEIRADLAEIVNEVAGIPVEDVQLDKSFVDDLDVDSLSMVEVVVAAEEKFGVSIPDDEVKNLKTVGDAVVVHRERPGLTRRRSAGDSRGTPTTRPSAPTRSHMTATMRKRVVVTGLGTTNPVGGDVATTWDALVKGQSGVRHLDDDWAEELPVKIAGRIAVEPTEVLERVKARRLDRSSQFAMVAAMEAWARRRPRGRRDRPRPARRRDGLRASAA